MAETHHKKRILSLIIALGIGWLHISGQPLCHVTQYDEADGVPSSHVTQLLQDDMGFLWFATWNGLCRYDGYEFRTFKPLVGDGCTMPTDRMRNIELLPGGLILCEEDNTSCLFDLKSYKFRDLNDREQALLKNAAGKYRKSRSLQRKPFTWTDNHQTQWTLDGLGKLSYREKASGQQTDYPLQQQFRTLTFAMPDNQGNLWALDYSSIYLFSTEMQRTQRLQIEPRAEVKSLFSDSKGRYWIATKDDEAVRVYQASDHKLIGYLTADGHISHDYTAFGAAIYCMYETKDGTLWLGSKPKGLFRLQEESQMRFKIDHFIDIPNHDVYHITQDRQGRLWVATLGGGICYTRQPNANNPHFSVPRHYPKDTGLRARYFLITHDGIMLVATSSGLMVSRLMSEADNMHFRLHQRESNRRQSLSCSATMDVVQDAGGRYFVSTESGGVNLIENQNLLDSVLIFRHLRDQQHVQPNDVVQSLAVGDHGELLAVGSHLITVFDNTGQSRILDARTFTANYRFSEAHPLRLNDGTWLFGLTDGAFVTSAQQMQRQQREPRLVLTGCSVQGGADNWGIAYADTIVLQPAERSFTLRFAALDYSGAKHISYAFRLLPNEQWNYIGHDRSATLLDLEPGSYRMEIRSTNSDGLWADNIRSLTIIVKPTFWESTLGHLCLVFLIIAIVATIVYTLLYIRRIQRQHRETLEKYLSLIKVGGEKASVSDHGTKEPETEKEEAAAEKALDPLLQRVMQYVEENISNSDANVGDMAAAAATSRSGLQRKLKQAMGITPQDLLREARIKRACLLLRESSKNISEIAYSCGFTDPKYFSRSFKQSTGVTPTEYKNSL